MTEEKGLHLISRLELFPSILACTWLSEQILGPQIQRADCVRIQNGLALSFLSTAALTFQNFCISLLFLRS